MSQRNRHHFPKLFPDLPARFDALLEITEFPTYRTAFEGLEAEYLQDLERAKNLVRNLRGPKRIRTLHELNRLPLENIFDRLVDLLDELCAIAFVSAFPPCDHLVYGLLARFC